VAADNEAVDIATKVLSANTKWDINLTGAIGRFVELAHHGGAVTDVVYFQVAATEAGLTSFAKADDEIPVLLPGERRRVGAPRNGFWIRLLSNGTAGVTVEATE
jgi:hypothetical protein